MADDATRHAWAAGFMDGEGCFCLLQAAGNTHPSTKRCMIGASQNKRQPLDILVELYGGRVRRCVPANKTPFFQWQIANAEQVKYALERMLPYLANKKREAEVIYAYAMTIGWRGKKLSPEVIQLRTDLIEQHREAREAIDYGR